MLASSIQSEEIDFDEIVDNYNKDESPFFFGNIYRV